MPKYIENATSYNYKVSYEVDGQLVSPSSASITLRKNDGTVVGGISDTALTIPPAATSSVFTISGANNTASLVYELRYIAVKFVYNSQTYYINDFYALRSNLRLPVTKDEVRGLAGLSSTELADDQIDLFAAYDQLADDVDSSIDNILTSGSVLIPAVQQGVRARAALNAMTMIETMVNQSEQADNTFYKRFSTIDFEAALDRLEAMYSDALAKIDGLSAGDVTPFIVVTGTDPVTNT